VTSAEHLHVERDEVLDEHARAIDLGEIRIRREELQLHAGRPRIALTEAIRERDEQRCRRARRSHAEQRGEARSCARAACREHREHEDEHRRLGSEEDERNAPRSEDPLRALFRDRAIGQRRAGAIEREQRRAEARREGRYLHPAEQRPVDDPERERHDGVERGRVPRDAADEARGRSDERRHAEHRDDRRPHAEPASVEADEMTDREDDGVERCGLARRISLTGDPLEGMPGRERAREVEMDVDVVERGGEPPARGVSGRYPETRCDGERRHERECERTSESRSAHCVGLAAHATRTRDGT
jgi:hypothetical protein